MQFRVAGRRRYPRVSGFFLWLSAVDLRFIPRALAGASALGIAWPEGSTPGFLAVVCSPVISAATGAYRLDLPNILALVGAEASRFTTIARSQSSFGGHGLIATLSTLSARSPKS